MPKRGPEARLEQLLAGLDDLRVDRQLGLPAPYQQLVLLWAIGRTRQRMPRMIAFNDAKTELSRLLHPFAVGKSSPDPALPWFALRNSDWWEIDFRTIDKPLGVRTRAAIRASNPHAGLSLELHHLLSDDPRFLKLAVAALSGAASVTAPVEPLLRHLQLTAD